MSETLHRWLPRRQFSLLCSTVLPYPKQHYQPFHPADNYKSACAGELSADVSELIDLLTEESTAVWMCCGGSAPIDYILVVRTKQGKFELRFMDAKHKSRVTELPSDERQSMIVKAKMVHGGLAHGIEKLLVGTVVAPFEDDHLLIVSNVDRAAVDLSPATFDWHPWSKMMFLEGTTN